MEKSVLLDHNVSGIDILHLRQKFPLKTFCICVPGDIYIRNPAINSMKYMIRRDINLKHINKITDLVIMGTLQVFQILASGILKVSYIVSFLRTLSYNYLFVFHCKCSNSRLLLIIFIYLCISHISLL